MSIYRLEQRASSAYPLDAFRGLIRDALGPQAAQPSLTLPQVLLAVIDVLAERAEGSAIEDMVDRASLTLVGWAIDWGFDDGTAAGDLEDWLSSAPIFFYHRRDHQLNGGLRDAENEWLYS